jgi:hypothetical protein
MLLTVDAATLTNQRPQAFALTLKWEPCSRMESKDLRLFCVDGIKNDI